MPIDDEGLLIEEELDALLARGPKLVAFAHVSNVLGTINPVADITARAHAAGAVVLVDGAQAAPHLPLDVGALGADFYAWTAHKAYGPTGIGVLHGRRELLEAMPPFLGGGHMISRVTKEGSRWAEPPVKFEAGTSAIAEAVGLGAAVDYLERFGMDAVWEHSRDVVGYAVERLRDVDGLAIHGPSDLAKRGSVISFALDGIHPHDVAEILGREGVCVRAGHHCAQVLMERLGVPATTRASFAVHSTHDDVDRLIAGLAKVQEIFAADGRALPREHPRALQAAAELRRAGRARPRVRGQQPALRRRAEGAAQRRRGRARSPTCASPGTAARSRRRRPRWPPRRSSGCRSTS